MKECTTSLISVAITSLLKHTRRSASKSYMQRLVHWGTRAMTFWHLRTYFFFAEERSYPTAATKYRVTVGNLVMLLTSSQVGR